MAEGTELGSNLLYVGFLTKRSRCMSVVRVFGTIGGLS